MPKIYVLPFNQELCVNNFRLQPEIDVLRTQLIAFLPAGIFDRETLLNNYSCNVLAELALAMLQVDNLPGYNTAKDFATAALRENSLKNSGEHDSEVRARANFALGIICLEENADLEALKKFNQASHGAKTDWLKANVFHHLGLVYLKMEDFQRALTSFTNAIALIKTQTTDELICSLPLLTSYNALAIIRHAISVEKTGNIPVDLLQNATEMFLKALKPNQHDPLISKDFWFHIIHRGIIACELAEHEKKQCHEKKAQHYFQEAKKIFRASLDLSRQKTHRRKPIAIS